jgi:hypothetical protein
MSNVIKFHGHMHEAHHVPFPPATRRELSDAEHDARIAANRWNFDQVMDDDGAPTLRVAPLRRPRAIPLDNSLLARASRWLRNLRLKGPL